MRVQLTDILAILSLALHTVSSVGLTVPEGSPITLNTTRHEDRATVTDMKWKFNQTQTIVSYAQKYRDATVYDLYKGRVEFSQSDFSLTLKNVQRNDSGLYTAVMDFTNKPEETIAAYELSVLEKPPIPWWIVVVCIAGLLVILMLVIIIIKRRLKGGAQTDHNPQDPVSQPGAVESPGSTDNPYDVPMSQTKCSAGTVYDMLQFNRLLDSSSTQDAPVLHKASADPGSMPVYAVPIKEI